METTFSKEQLQLWFSGKYHHGLYEETCKAALDLRTHADGLYPKDLIEERRPNESEQVQEYRQKIWQPITKPYFNKVLASLNKIRRSTEWSIKFDESVVPSIIPDLETLSNYCEYNFPLFESITNWAFSVLLREWSVDSNAWLVMMPFDEETLPNEYVRPFPFIYRSDQIIEAIADEVLVVISDDKCVYVEDGISYYGDRYYVVTTTDIQRWDQSSRGKEFKQTWIYEHNLDELPAFKMKSVVLKMYENDYLNESRLSPMLPRFNEAAREYSDLQAEVVLNIHNEKWEYGQEDCTECKGSGAVSIPGFRNQKDTCPTCKGSGAKPRGPYSTLIIKSTMAGEASNMPTPPIGYLQKETNIVETQDKRVDKHIVEGLAAINMEFLAQRPLVESGIAKAYDADETNNFVHSCAEDIVAIMDLVYYFTNELRYIIVVPDFSVRQDMLPTIAVPERFDLFSAKMIEEEMATAKEKNFNAVILKAMEVEYANRKFSSNPEIRDRLALELKLDPLPHTSVDDKMGMLSNKGITEKNYVISCNISLFVNRAIEELGQENFYDMPYTEQMQQLNKYADEQIQGTSIKKEIITEEDLGA